jgi:hypothetical protein
VKQVCRILVLKEDTFGNAPPKTIVHIMWAIHIDARTFFSSPMVEGIPPMSSLRWLWNELGRSVVTPITGCPEFQLMGEPAAAAQGHNGANGFQRPEDMLARTPTQDMPVGGSHKLAVVHPAFTGALKQAKIKHPAMTVSLIMKAAGLSYKTIKLGPPGSCLDYMVLGLCKTKGCQYKHIKNFTSSDAQATPVAKALMEAIPAYEAAL